jgi:glucosyl-dolichyl phosphate glucuronosyltransferase
MSFYPSYEKAYSQCYRSRPTFMNQSTATLLSVIIPTRNHAQLLSGLLDTLAAQMPVPFRWEVMVIDNGSTDQTAKLTHEKISSLPIEIRYIYEPRPGLHNGRHRGALEASGRYLAYLDDDVLLTPAWIHGLEKIMSGQAEAVVGRILPKWETRPPAWLTKLTLEPGYLSLLDMGPEGFYIDPRFVYGDDFFIPAQIVFDLKGFHPDSMPVDQLRYRGDGEYALMMKFKEAGLRAWYDPVATAYHRIPRARMSFDYMCRWEYAQGISDSFNEIRARQYNRTYLADHSINHPELRRKTIRYYLDRIRELNSHQLLSSLATRIMRIVPLSQPNINARLRQAYWEGYKYHQSEVRKDPGLLRWVLQEDYWDCQP